MNALLSTLYLFFILASAHAQGAEQIPSPDHQLTITQAEAIATGGEYQLQRATLRRGKNIVWEYASRSRALKFSWSPDSRHCLFAQWNGARDVSLFLIFIDDDYSPRLREIDLGAVHEAIIAPIPKFYNRPGGFAKVTWIDWENVRWITPAMCQLQFFDRNTGLDSEARLQIEVGEDHPKVTVLSVTDKIDRPKE